MIHITVVDPSLNIASVKEPDLIIRDQNEYVFGYINIVEAIHSGKDINVSIHNKAVGNWLKVLANRYGDQSVYLEELTYHSQLEKQIGIEIPEYITDQQIDESNLLDLNIPALPNTSFENYLLEIFFGSILALPGNLRRIGVFFTHYESEQWLAALDRPLVREIYQKRVRKIGAYLDEENRVAERELLDWLDSSPEVLLQNLFAIKILGYYPEEIGRRVFGGIYPKIIDLKLDLRKIPVVLSGNEKAIDEIQIYLESFVSSPSEIELERLILQMSGYLEVEFDAAFRILTSEFIHIDIDVVELIRKKFSSIDHIPRVSQALSDLDLIISKDVPSTPQQEWDEDQWIQWSIEEYLPYRFWLENTGRLDDQIGEIASEYADWLYQHYSELNYHSERMAWKSLLNLKEEMRSFKGVVLIVIIDNLNAKFYPFLLEQMQQQRFYEQSLAYCFSALPSCTEVSKKSIITGLYTPFSETAYKSRVEEIWSDRLKKSVRYIPNIGDFRAIEKKEHYVYFLNYLPIDITLHQSERKTGISHAQAIRGYLSSLSQDIRSFSERIGKERELMVIISSDHGSTRIPRGTTNVIQGDYYRKKALDEHHRYIAISDEELDKLPGNSKYDCYIFDREVYELNTNYLVARRLYRFLPTDDHAYIHGGLTPEETLIPLAVFQPVTISPKEMSVDLISSKKIYVGTKSELILELTNLNNYSCEDISVEIPDPTLDAEIHQIREIPKLKREQLVIPVRCPKTADPFTGKLHIRVQYKFLGQPWANEIDLPVEIIQPAKPKFDLDDL